MTTMTLDLDDVQLPPSVQAELDAMQEDGSGADETQARLDQISVAIIGKRTDAINGRQVTGLEEALTAFEDAYQGIDELNRGEVGRIRWTVNGMSR